MKCIIALKSEFEWTLAKYLDMDGTTGVADIEIQQAWVFIDNIVKDHEDIVSRIITEITCTVIHELVHLCGYRDEDVAERAESLLVYEGYRWSYRPLLTLTTTTREKPTRSHIKGYIKQCEETIQELEGFISHYKLALPKINQKKRRKHK